MANARRIGFMQGRLSPKPPDRIQAFPKEYWREEFPRAEEIGFGSIELIHDVLHLDVNPLSSDAGRRSLVSLSEKHKIALASICADYFMVCPLEESLSVAIEVVQIASDIGCGLVELPFVDSSSLVRRRGDLRLRKAIETVADVAERKGILVSIESDLAPLEFREFLIEFSDNVGVNLDLGNSAALGYDVRAECRAYGERIFNVHIKDRLLGGKTVPLTTGHTDFLRAFQALHDCHYQGDLILQTAPDPDYIAAARTYRMLTEQWSNGTWTST